jgi:hypothetical protein
MVMTINTDIPTSKTSIGLLQPERQSHRIQRLQPVTGTAARNRCACSASKGGISGRDGPRPDR